MTRIQRLVLLMHFFSSTALAGESSPHLDVPAFMESIVAPIRSERCTKALSDYTSRFEPIFQKWTLENGPRITAGRRLLESDAERTGRPLSAFIRSLEQTTILGMQAMSESELREFCEASLLVLSSAP